MFHNGTRRLTLIVLVQGEQARADLIVRQQPARVTGIFGGNHRGAAQDVERTQSDVANVQIAALTSRSALQRRLKEGYLKMIPIAEQNIVRLAPVRPAPEENAIRPVANDQVGR